MSTRELLSILAPATVSTGVLLAWAELSEPAGGEPLPLRWARIAAGHPIRTGLALHLLWMAFRTRNRPGKALDPSNKEALARGADRFG